MAGRGRDAVLPAWMKGGESRFRSTPSCSQWPMHQLGQLIAPLPSMLCSWRWSGSGRGTRRACGSSARGGEQRDQAASPFLCLALLR